jgi:hypothetical protein
MNPSLAKSCNAFTSSVSTIHFSFFSHVSTVSCPRSLLSSRRVIRHRALRHVLHDTTASAHGKAESLEDYGVNLRSSECSPPRLTFALAPAWLNECSWLVKVLLLALWLPGIRRSGQGQRSRSRPTDRQPPRGRTAIARPPQTTAC